MKNIKYCINNQAWDQTRVLVWAQIDSSQVRGQVWNQVRGQIVGQVRGQM